MSESTAPIFAAVLEKYLSRRHFLRRSSLLAAAVSATSIGAGSLLAGCDNKAAKIVGASLSFAELPHGLSDQLEVAAGYSSQVLVRWGDPIFADAPEFDPMQQTAGSQSRQFGFNNDFIGFVPLPFGSESSDRGLLVVNHEYTSTGLMFPGSPKDNALTLAQTEVDIAAHGLSVVEVVRSDKQWMVVLDSKFNRRITPNTPMQMTGPAAGSLRLQTAISKDGVQTLGTYGNCAGGVTPWGTILTGEENVDGFFLGDETATAEAENYQRFTMYTGYKNWGKYFSRWDLAQNPREPLHVGWIVEIDPYDPESVPKKRTALGRFKHEGCNIALNPDGQIVAYTGDDQQFEYIYKFVSNGIYNPDDRRANMDLLADGTLYVARFNSDGSLDWLPLVFGEGPLTLENGFESQADVCIDARKAADLVGATPMDRPEDVDVNPVNGRVYAMLTNNTRRTAEQVDAANPRAHNNHGQVVEFWPANGDHTENKFQWDLFLLAGNPASDTTRYHPKTSADGWLSCPDNCAFDRNGNLWIATDGAEKSGIADGLYVTAVSGEQRALTRHFLSTPQGAELCGPFFTPDSENLFLSIQHPAEGSTFEQPLHRWPDFDPKLPPRPAVIVIRKQGGGVIGS